MRTLSVTPELARRWFDERWPNRKLRPATIASFARAMDNGQWQPDRAPLWFTGKPDTERLSDGQHRVAAVILHGKPVTMLVAGLGI